VSTFTFEALWIEHEPIVQTVAHEYGNKGHRYGADTDDFRQEFIAWMLDNEGMLVACATRATTISSTSGIRPGASPGAAPTGTPRTS
jgi:hypothetical protein